MRIAQKDPVHKEEFFADHGCKSGMGTRHLHRVHDIDLLSFFLNRWWKEDARCCFRHLANYPVYNAKQSPEYFIVSVPIQERIISVHSHTFCNCLR
jgi:hypothetical protein